MKIRTLIIGYVLALALFLFAKRHPDASSPTEFHAVVDLTHAMDAHALAYEHLRENPLCLPSSSALA